MAQYINTVEIYSESVTGGYTAQPHIYRKTADSLEEAKNLIDLLWQAIEIEELDNQKLYVEAVIEKDGEYVDSETFYIKSHIARTNVPSSFIIWGEQKPYIFSIDRNRSLIEVEY